MSGIEYKNTPLLFVCEFNDVASLKTKRKQPICDVLRVNRSPLHILVIRKSI